MATAAQVIVEFGIARASGNDPGKLSVDGELLGRLNRVFQSLYALASRQRPDWFSGAFTLALAGNPATGLLSAASPSGLTDLIDIRRAYGNTGTVAAGVKIHVVPETEVYRSWQIAPCMFQRGLSLVSRGAAGDPINTDVIGLTVLDAPATLVALATNLDTRFPVRHHEILVNDLALYLDAKDEGRNAEQFTRLQADQQAKLAAFAREYDLSANAVEQVFEDRVPVAGRG